MESNGMDEYQCEVREDLIDEYVTLANKSIEEASKQFNCPVLQAGESDVGYDWSETH